MCRVKTNEGTNGECGMRDTESHRNATERAGLRGTRAHGICEEMRYLVSKGSADGESMQTLGWTRELEPIYRSLDPYDRGLCSEGGKCLIPVDCSLSINPSSVTPWQEVWQVVLPLSKLFSLISA